MKKLIFGTLFLASVGVGVFSCEKNPEIEIPLNTERKLDIEKVELQNILNNLSSEEKVGPGWWEKFEKWVNSHSGRSQEYLNGQPACSGGGGCGPCAGICIGGSGLTIGGENGEITDSDLNSGLRPLLFTVILNSNSPNDYKLIIDIPHQYVEDFIMDGVLKLNNDIALPDFIVTPLNSNSGLMKSGTYPTVINSKNGDVTTIVNLTIE
jgi:hypothetical protein